MNSASNLSNENLDARIKQKTGQIDVYYDAQEYQYYQELSVPKVCQSQQGVQIHDNSNDTQLKGRTKEVINDSNENSSRIFCGVDDIAKQHLTRFKNDSAGQDQINEYDHAEQEYQHYSNTNPIANMANVPTTTASTSWFSTLTHNSTASAPDALESDNSLPNEQNNMATNTCMISSETWKQDDGSSTDDNSSATVDDNDDNMVDELEGEYQLDSDDTDGNSTTMPSMGNSKIQAELNDQGTVRQERVLSSSETLQRLPALSSPSPPQRATATEYPCSSFDQRSSPPPKKKTRVKRQWHERIDGQPPPKIIKWDDDDDDETDVDKSDNVPNVSDISILDHTPKRRCLPFAPAPTPENELSHRYQPPLTNRQRQEMRQRSTSPPSRPSSSSSRRHMQQPESQGHPIVSSPCRRKVYIKWTDDELGALEEGLGYYQDRQWRKILTKFADRFAPGRTNVDLRDKARNEIKRRQIQGEDLGPFSYAL